jgi:capsule polysaccharide export protein KpsE/RkpR
VEAHRLFSATHEVAVSHFEVRINQVKRTTMEESAELEVQGAEARLENGIRSLREFQKIFGEINDDGVFIFRAGIDAALLASLERELRGHHIEIDEAWRAVKHAQHVLAESRVSK